MNLLNIFKRKKPPKAESAVRIKKPLSFIMRIRGDYTLQNSEIIFAAISRISNALSAMPVQLYQGTTARYKKINELLTYGPNATMTACTFFKTMEACRCAYGNCYALKIVDGANRVIRLDVLDPSRVKPVLNTDDNELWYQVTPETGEQYYIHSWYMIHVPFISTNGYIGVNPVAVLFDTLHYSENIQKFSVAQLEKGINAAVVLEAPANMGKKQKDAMLADFIKTYQDSGGNILLLESGVTAKALNLSPVDTRLLEVEKITRSKVAMVYNLPPHLLGDYSTSSFSSNEQQMIEFLSLTMLPIVTAYEQELNKKLLTPDERRNKYHWKFNMDAIMRADAKTSAEVDLKALRSGAKSPNDIRTAKGEPKIKNGDTYYISRDLVPLEFLINNPGLLSGGGGLGVKQETAGEEEKPKEDNENARDEDNKVGGDEKSGDGNADE